MNQPYFQIDNSEVNNNQDINTSKKDKKMQDKIKELDLDFIPAKFIPESQNSRRSSINKTNNNNNNSRSTSLGLKNITKQDRFTQNNQSSLYFTDRSFQTAKQKRILTDTSQEMSQLSEQQAILLKNLNGGSKSNKYKHNQKHYFPAIDVNNSQNNLEQKYVNRTEYSVEKSKDSLINININKSQYHTPQTFKTSRMLTSNKGFITPNKTKGNFVNYANSTVSKFFQSSSEQSLYLLNDTQEMDYDKSSLQQEKKKKMFEYFNKNFSNQKQKKHELELEGEREDREIWNNLISNPNDGTALENDQNRKQQLHISMQRITDINDYEETNKTLYIKQFKHFSTLKDYKNFTKQKVITPYHSMLEEAIKNKKLPLRYKIDQMEDDGKSLTQQNFYFNNNNDHNKTQGSLNLYSTNKLQNQKNNNINNTTTQFNQNSQNTTKIYQNNLNLQNQSNNFEQFLNNSQIQNESQMDFNTTNMTLNTTQYNAQNLSSTLHYSNNKQINLKNYGMNDQDLEVASKGILKMQSDLEEVNFQNNRITDKGLLVIINNINTSVKQINVSQNSITLLKNQEIFANFFNQTVEFRIKVLNLESNKISDNAINYFFSKLTSSCPLKSLNLSKNQLTNQMTHSLKNFLLITNNLNELYLHWNMISSKGGQVICQAMDENTTLKVLDLSFNCLGKYKHESEQCSQYWAKIIKKDYSLDLVHLDLSYNYFNYQECLVFQDALKYNHTIHGFHFNGNIGKIDYWGFLVDVEDISQINQHNSPPHLPNTQLLMAKKIKEMQKDKKNKNKEPSPIQSHSSSIMEEYNNVENKKQNLINYIDKNNDFQVHQYQRIHSINYRPINQTFINQEESSFCWVCQGWNEQKFTYTNIDSGPSAHDPPFIHFNLDNYQPHKMKKVNDEQFEYYFMCPPFKQVQFFYSVQGNQIIAYDYKKINNKNEIKVKFSDTVLTVELQQLNTIHLPQQQQILTDIYQPDINSQPRFDEENIYLPQKEILFEEWKFENSIFRTYKKDNEELILKCFEYDWEKSKLTKFIKTEVEQEEIKNILRKNYHIIKALYKYYASQKPQGDIWSITSNVFTEFLNSAGMVDGYGLNLNNLDFNFIVTNSVPKQSLKTQQQVQQAKLNPDRALVRFQLMEIFVRLADEKYVKTEMEDSLVKATELFQNEMNQFYIQCIDDEQIWRDQFYWTEKNDKCYKYYKPILSTLYNRFAGIHYKKLTTVKPLLLQDLQLMIKESGLMEEYPDTMKERDLLFAYNLSMMTQVNEYSNDRHLEMNFVEFLECFARIADVVSPLPFKEQYKSEDGEKDIWPLQKRKHLPLHIKIEGLIAYFYQKFWEGDERRINNDLELADQSIFFNEISKIKKQSNALFKMKINSRLRGDDSIIQKFKEQKQVQTKKKLSTFLSQIKQNGTGNSNSNLGSSFAKKLLRGSVATIFSGTPKKNDSNSESRRGSQLSSAGGDGTPQNNLNLPLNNLNTPKNTKKPIVGKPNQFSDAAKRMSVAQNSGKSPSGFLRKIVANQKFTPNTQSSSQLPSDVEKTPKTGANNIHQKQQISLTDRKTYQRGSVQIQKPKTIDPNIEYYKTKDKQVKKINLNKTTNAQTQQSQSSEQPKQSITSITSFDDSDDDSVTSLEKIQKPETNTIKNNNNVNNIQRPSKLLTSFKMIQEEEEMEALSPSPWKNNKKNSKKSGKKSKTIVPKKSKLGNKVSPKIKNSNYTNAIQDSKNSLTNFDDSGSVLSSPKKKLSIINTQQQ